MVLEGFILELDFLRLVKSLVKPLSMGFLKSRDLFGMLVLKFFEFLPLGKSDLGHFLFQQRLLVLKLLDSLSEGVLP